MEDGGGLESCLQVGDCAVLTRSEYIDLYVGEPVKIIAISPGDATRNHVWFRTLLHPNAKYDRCGYCIHKDFLKKVEVESA